METFEPNYKRSISIEDDFMDKQIDDLLYGAMYSLATYKPGNLPHGAGGKMYLTESKYKSNKKTFYTLLSLKEIKDQRHALQRHLQKLIDNKLIDKEVVDGKTSYIFNSPKGRFYSISIEILKRLSIAKSTNSIKVFVYLAYQDELTKKLIEKGEREDKYSFTQVELIRMLGYKGEKHKETNEMIRIILEDLSETGFIRFVPYKDYREVGDKIVPIPRLRLLMVAKNEQERELIKTLNNSPEEEESVLQALQMIKTLNNSHEVAAAPEIKAVASVDEFHF